MLVNSSNSSGARMISFSEFIKDRDASVRVTDDDLIYAVDLVMVMTGKNRDDAGKVLRNLSEETFPSATFVERSMPGRGNACTKLLSFKDAMDLIMVLPGKVAKETRTQLARSIQRLINNDEESVSDTPAVEPPCPKPAEHLTISFNEIVKDRDSNVRLTEDGFIFAVDLVKVVAGVTGDYAGQILRRLPDDVFDSSKMQDRQISRHGGPKTKVISFKDALKLVMVLPGKVAKETRTQFAGIIQRYMAGDVSLVEEVQANAESSGAIQQMARASLAEEQVPPAVLAPEIDEFDLSRKRKLASLEVEKLELDLSIQRQNAELERVGKITSAYKDICQSECIDEEARVVFKDYYLKMVNGKPVDKVPVIEISYNQLQPAGMAQMPVSEGHALPLAVAQPLSRFDMDNINHLAEQMGSKAEQMGSKAPDAVGQSSSHQQPNKLVNISNIALKMGLRLTNKDLLAVGVRLRQRYEDIHGHPPSKHDQKCDGRVTKVNSYMESDRDLIETVLREIYPV